MRLGIFLIGIFGLLLNSIQMVYSVQRHMIEGLSFLSSVNLYLSYFTAIINYSVSFTLLVFATAPQSRLGRLVQRPEVSGALCVYIIIVGGVYYSFLSHAWRPEGIEYYCNLFLHAFGPVAFFYLWFRYLRNGQLRYRLAVQWLAFPVSYFVYLLIRGELTGLYPYFFVDPRKYGYAFVGKFAFGILVLFVIVGTLLIWLDRKVKAPVYLPKP